MTRYKVLVDDNFHFMREEYRTEHGVFPTAEEAVAACKRIIDSDLNDMNQPNVTSAAQLYELYQMFGDDPFIVPVDPNDENVEFSALDYAKERCSSLKVPEDEQT
jgi:hypothetical protein